jgi:radical SAM superfamily enzyme YgiQ (UPF0313 family)
MTSHSPEKPERRRRALRIAFENVSPQYPVPIDRYCSDTREDRQSIMLLSCAAWAAERGAEVQVIWEPESRGHAKDVDAVFIVLFSVAAYALKNAIEAHRALADAYVIVCGPHAVSFPEHCHRAGADAVVGRCDQALFLEILNDVENARLRRRYATERPIARLPRYADFQALGFVPEQGFRSALASTGCPYTCSFCSDADSRFATIDAAEVVADIASCEEKLIVFNDPLFGLGTNGKAIMHGLSRLGDRHCMAFTTSSVLRQPDLRDLFADAGFVLLEIGLENLNAPYAKNRRSDIIEICSQSPFIVIVNYIYGLHPKDFGQETESYLAELTEKCPNVLPMVFVPFSLPETQLHQEHVKGERIFDPSYLCIGNEILSMRLPVNMTPAQYYDRLSALNQRLYEDHNARMGNWVAEHPRIPDRRKQVLLDVVRRQAREEEMQSAWFETVSRLAPDDYVPFAQTVLAETVPDFAGYDLAC